MANLFTPTGLEQDTGLLKERWAQDGSTLITVQNTVTTAGSALYTVTAGKTFYLGQAIAYHQLVDKTMTILDNATKKVEWATGGTLAATTMNFDPPIAFVTSVNVDTNTNSGEITFTGWEE